MLLNDNTFGAPGRNRTSTPLRATDFEAGTVQLVQVDSSSFIAPKASPAHHNCWPKGAVACLGWWPHGAHYGAQRRKREHGHTEINGGKDQVFALGERHSSRHRGQGPARGLS